MDRSDILGGLGLVCLIGGAFYQFGIGYGAIVAGLLFLALALVSALLPPR